MDGNAPGALMIAVRWTGALWAQTICAGTKKMQVHKDTWRSIRVEREYPAPRDEVARFIMSRVYPNPKVLASFLPAAAALATAEK
jgi:hypothetical protein